MCISYKNSPRNKYSMIRHGKKIENGAWTEKEPKKYAN